jgi:hypothetical protein
VAARLWLGGMLVAVVGVVVAVIMPPSAALVCACGCAGCARGLVRTIDHPAYRHHWPDGWVAGGKSWGRSIKQVTGV